MLVTTDWGTCLPSDIPEGFTPRQQSEVVMCSLACVKKMISHLAP